MIIYLVRHGAHALVNTVLCGRSDAISLSPEGVEQARQLAAGFAAMAIDLVQSSPRRRTHETAVPIAQAIGLAAKRVDDMDELDVGEWTGRSFTDLAADSGWAAWNESRGTTRPPGGESMAELQSRVVRHIEELKHSSAESVVIVTHAEPVRAALLHYRNMPLERFAEIQVAPASISILRSQGGQLLPAETNLPVLP